MKKERVLLISSFILLIILSGALYIESQQTGPVVILGDNQTHWQNEPNATTAIENTSDNENIVQSGEQPILQDTSNELGPEKDYTVAEDGLYEWKTCQRCGEQFKVPKNGEQLNYCPDCMNNPEVQRKIAMEYGD